MLLIKATIRSAIIRFTQKVVRTAADAKAYAIDPVHAEAPNLLLTILLVRSSPEARHHTLLSGIKKQKTCD